MTDAAVKPKLASGKNPVCLQDRVFVIPPLAAEWAWKIDARYDEIALGRSIYNYFRDYDSYAGRYVQSDPIGLGDGVNTYAYVANDPVQFFDRLGRGKEGGQSNIGGNDPLTPRMNRNTPQAEVDKAIEAAKKALKDGQLNPKRYRKVKGWLKVAQRGFSRSICPPFIEDIVLGVLAESCRNGDPLACESYFTLGGEIEHGT